MQKNLYILVPKSWCSDDFFPAAGTNRKSVAEQYFMRGRLLGILALENVVKGVANT